MYKQKDLIYVQGKGYKEQDLVDMIRFYQNNYQPDIVLPQGWNEDVSGQIFKHYPFYPSISKSTYKPHLYYEQYCHLSITFKEFLNYIEEEKPDEFVIYGTRYHHNNIKIKICYIKKEGNHYIIREIDIEDNGSNKIKYIYDNYNELIQFIIDRYQNLDKNYLYYNQFLFDLETTENIYIKRHLCMQYNDKYNGLMIRQYINNITTVPDIIDVNSFLINYSIYLFFLYNYLIFDEDKESVKNNIKHFIDLIEDIPDDVNQLKEIMAPYDINNSITYDEINGIVLHL